MATAVSTIIKAAMRALGALKAGGTPTAAEYADGVEAFNMLLSNLSENEVFIPSRTREALSFSAIQPSYTIGSGGDLDTDWPLSIEHALIRYEGVDYPIKVATAGEYKNLRDKYVTGRPASLLYYEPSYPLGVLYFSVQPSTDYSLILTSFKPIAEVADEDATLTLRLGYDRALKWLLAQEMATEYGQANVGLVLKHAEEAMQTIERHNFASQVNAPVIDAGARGALRDGFDITSGDWT
jgi:hypothetical protein